VIVQAKEGHVDIHNFIGIESTCHYVPRHILHDDNTMNSLFITPHPHVHVISDVIKSMSYINTL